MALTVDPGHDLRVHRHSGVGPGRISAAIEEDSLGKPEKPFFGLRDAFSVDLSLKTGSDLGMSARIIQVRPSRNPRW